MLNKKRKKGSTTLVVRTENVKSLADVIGIDFTGGGSILIRFYWKSRIVVIHGEKNFKVYSATVLKANSALEKFLFTDKAAEEMGWRENNEYTGKQGSGKQLLMQQLLAFDKS